MSLIVSHRPGEKSLTSHPSLEGETSETRDSPRRVTLWLVGRLADVMGNGHRPVRQRGDHLIGHRVARLQPPSLLGCIAVGNWPATIGGTR